MNQCQQLLAKKQKKSSVPLYVNWNVWSVRQKAHSQTPTFQALNISFLLIVPRLEKWNALSNSYVDLTYKPNKSIFFWKPWHAFFGQKMSTIRRVAHPSANPHPLHIHLVMLGCFKVTTSRRSLKGKISRQTYTKPRLNHY